MKVTSNLNNSTPPHYTVDKVDNLWNTMQHVVKTSQQVDLFPTPCSLNSHTNSVVWQTLTHVEHSHNTEISVVEKFSTCVWAQPFNGV
jgi:hypothetical protein